MKYYRKAYFKKNKNKLGGVAMKKVSKIIQKVVASMIVFVMTMAQCAIVGFSAISYAVDMIATNNDNVQFKAYFETEEGEVTEIKKSIEEANLKLKIDVAVKNEGYLNNGQISMQNAGFKIKEEQAQNEYVEKIENGIIYLKQINAEEEANIEISIESNKDAEIRAESLHQESIVNLAGTYYYSKGSIQIDGKSKVKIDWTLPADVKAELATKLITNATYKVQEQNKKVVQFLISNRLTGNRYPIKTTQIQASIPEGAENIEVHKRTTNATNGDKEFTEANYSVESNKQIGETEQTGENKLIINVENTETNGSIGWGKNSPDIYVVTYEFPEAKNLGTEKITVNSRITAYDTAQTVLNSNTQEINLNEEKQEITSIDTKAKETEVYKGKIYTGEERDYIAYTRIYVDYAKAIDEIKIKEKASKFIINEQTQETEAQPTEKEANIQYKEIKLNKQEIEKILGTEWKINIKDQNNNQINLTSVRVNEIIQNNQAQSYEQEVIAKTEEQQIKVEENGIITIKLEAGAKALEITTSKPQNNGVITIQKIKAIQKTNYTREEIKELTGIKENSEVTVTKEDNKTEKQAKETSIKLLETETKATLSLSRNNFTTVSTNENIEITAKLNTNGENLNLYKNPEVDIVFPKEISKVQVTNATALYKNGLEIESNKIHQTEDGRKALYIKLKGEQTTYDANGGVELHLYVDIDTDNTITEDKTAQIEMKYKNENDGTEKTEKQNIEIQYMEKQETNNNQSINNNQQTNTTSNNQQANTANNDSIQRMINRVLRSTPLTANNTSGEENVNILLTGNSQQTEQGIQLTLVAQAGETTLQENDEVRAGEIITYTATITNNKTETAQNITVTATIPENTTLIEKNPNFGQVDESGEEGVMQPYFIEKQDRQICKTITVGAGKSQTFTYKVRVNKNVSEPQTMQANLSATYQSEEIQTANITNNIKKSSLIVTLEPVAGTEDDPVASGQYFLYRLLIENITEIEQKNIEVTVNKNDLLKLTRIRCTIGDNDTEIPLDQLQKFTISSLPAKQIADIEVSTEIQGITEELNKSEISVEAKDSAGNKYRSNKITREAESAKLNIQLQASAQDDNGYINPGDEVKYKITIKNEGNIEAGNMYIRDNISDYLEIKTVTLNGENCQYELQEEDNGDIEEKIIDDTGSRKFIYIEKNLEAGATATVEITAKVQSNLKTSKLLKIANKASAHEGMLIFLTEEQSYHIKANSSDKEDNTDDYNNNDDNNDNHNNNDNNNNNNNNNDQGKKGYSISGIVWVDSNQNGARDNEEELLEGITVYAIDPVNNTIAINTNGTDISSITNSNGQYTLTNIPKGEYIIGFEYDTQKYVVTVYQAESIGTDKNSDAVKASRIVNGQEKTLAVTDSINLQQNISNIDLGLKEATLFDLDIAKAVSKITVTNKEGTKTYEYNDTNLAKTEIKGKNLSGSTVVIEYKIKIINNGEIAGYAKSIVDYMPTALTFNSNLNNDWYKKGKNLYNDSLANILIEPGETKELKLILTKDMTNSNTGLTNNKAEIAKSYNELGLEDIDINSKNENQETSSADVIVMPSTGETMINISIVIIILISICGVTYFITKKLAERR